MFFRLYPQLFVGGLLSYLHYSWLFAYSGLQHVFLTIWVAWRLSYKRTGADYPSRTLGFTPGFSWSQLLIFFSFLCCAFCSVCLRPVYPTLPVSLDCPFLIAPSVFSNVYWQIFKAHWTIQLIFCFVFDLEVHVIIHACTTKLGRGGKYSTILLTA